MDKKNCEKVRVLCVKQGTKYTSQHAENLFKMVDKNTSCEIDFQCLNDDNTDFHGLKGHWSKMVLFKEVEPFIYFDLDIIIQKNIDYLINAKVEKHLKLIKIDWANEEYAKSLNIHPDNKRLWVFNNSSVIKAQNLKASGIWDHFMANQNRFMDEYYGIDTYLWHEWEDHCSYFKSGFFYSYLHGAIFPDKRSMHRPDYNVCLLDGDIMPEDIDWIDSYIC
jgi:hypothetical protein